MQGNTWTIDNSMPTSNPIPAGFIWTTVWQQVHLSSCLSVLIKWSADIYSLRIARIVSVVHEALTRVPWCGRPSPVTGCWPCLLIIDDVRSRCGPSEWSAPLPARDPKSFRPESRSIFSISQLCGESHPWRCIVSGEVERVSGFLCAFLFRSHDFLGDY